MSKNSYIRFGDLTTVLPVAIIIEITKNELLVKVLIKYTMNKDSNVTSEHALQYAGNFSHTPWQTSSSGFFRTQTETHFCQNMNEDSGISLRDVVLKWIFFKIWTKIQASHCVMSESRNFPHTPQKRNHTVGSARDTKLANYLFNKNIRAWIIRVQTYMLHSWLIKANFIIEKEVLLLVKMKQKKLLKMRSLPKVLLAQAIRATT